MTTNWLDGLNGDLERVAFDKLSPEEVLIEYDQLLAFTCRDAHNTLFFAYAIENSTSGSIYFIVPTNQLMLTNLKVGALSIRQALEQPISWAVEATLGQKVSRAWRVPLSSLPEDAVPEDSVLLWPSLKPFVSITARGQDIKEGNVPTLVIRQIIQGVEKSLKILNDHVEKSAAALGGPHASNKARYQLNAQYVKVASFSIGFRPPDIENADDQQEFNKVLHLFQSGVNWLATKAETNNLDNDEQIAIFEAMKHLTPSQTDAVETYEIGGRVALTGSVTVNKDDRKEINKHLRERRKSTEESRDEVEDLSGKIGQLDRDFLWFALRNEHMEIRCEFTSDIFDDIWDAFESQYDVRVLGTKKADHLEVIYFRRLSSSESE